jgi:hypothetical protein
MRREKTQPTTVKSCRNEVPDRVRMQIASMVLYKIRRGSLRLMGLRNKCCKPSLKFFPLLRH